MNYFYLKAVFDPGQAASAIHRWILAADSMHEKTLKKNRGFSGFSPVERMKLIRTLACLNESAPVLSGDPFRTGALSFNSLALVETSRSSP